MKKLLAAGLAFASVLALEQPARAAADTQIDCPTNIRVQVTSPLDAEWVATPQSSRPVGVSVENIAGRQTLACHYRVFGSIYYVYRHFPPGHDFCAPLTLSMAFGCYVPGHR
jgi:hypothetical protein